jgi:hypothetical protein
LNGRDLVKEGIVGVERRRSREAVVSAGATQANGCPVPQTGIGLYRFNGNVEGTRVKAAATESKPRDVTFLWNFPEGGAEYVTRVAPGRPIV